MTRKRRPPKLPPIKVVGDAEAEQADFIVVIRKANDPGFFSGNLEGTCSACGEPVVFRPNAPKKPRRICTTCLPLLATKGQTEQ